MQNITNTLVGKAGETLACDLLTNKGYEILHQNFRFGKKEIDIIARQGELLVFVEVKLRKNNRFGYPEQTVTPAKQANIKEVAEHFLHASLWQGNIRFDIIAITRGRQDTEILHIEDAF